MDIFIVILPIITLLLGFFLDLLSRLLVEKISKRKEFERKRFQLVVFPVYMIVLYYTKRDNERHRLYETSSIGIDEYFFDKIARIEKILLENSTYVSPKMLSLYTMFVGNLYDINRHDDDSSWEDYEELSECVMAEYEELSSRVLSSTYKRRK